MLRPHDAVVERGVDVELLTAAAALVLEPAPVALGEAEVGGGPLAHLEQRVGMELARRSPFLAMLRMEEFERARARGQHKWVLFRKLRAADRRAAWLLEFGQRIVTP